MLYSFTHNHKTITESTVKKLLFAYKKFPRYLQGRDRREYFLPWTNPWRIIVITKRMWINLGSDN